MPAPPKPTILPVDPDDLTPEQRAVTELYRQLRDVCTGCNANTVIATSLSLFRESILATLNTPTMDFNAVERALAYGMVDALEMFAGLNAIPIVEPAHIPTLTKPN